MLICNYMFYSAFRNNSRELLLILNLFLLLTSCKQEINRSQISEQPTSITVTGRLLKQTDLKPPVTVNASSPTVASATIGNWKLSPVSVTQAKDPVIITLDQSKIFTPGDGNTLIPSVIKYRERSVSAHPPVRIEVKDAYVRDKNPYNFSSIGKLQGLRHDQIRAIDQDNTGNLWLGTDDGLTKFDGKYLSHYTTNQGLTNNLILSVYHDSKGNIWAGTFRGGAVKLDGDNFTIFSKEDGLPSDIVNWITEDSSGNIWMATGGGVVKYDGKNLTVYTQDNGLCNNDTRYLLFDKYGKLWITTNIGGISIFDGVSFTNYTVKEGLPQNEATSLATDSKGNVWIGLSSKGIIKYDGYNYYHYGSEQGLIDGSIRSIMEDYTGNIWIGTTTSGLFRFDGISFTNFNINEGLGSEYVRCLMEDRSGNIWMGTRTAGLVRYNGDIFTHLTEEEGLSNSRVMSIMKDRLGRVWMGTFGGHVTIMKEEKVSGTTGKYMSYFGVEQGLNASRIYSIIEDRKGNIWFGTDGGGISYFNGNKVYTYTTDQGLSDNTIRDIYEDSKGIIWIGTYGGGVSKFDGTNFTNYSIESGISSNNILAIFEDSKGTIWFGTDGGGITSLNGSQFTHFTTKEGFFSNTVYSIEEDKEGNVWFGTAGEGLVCYNHKTFTRYNSLNGLNNDHVLSLLEDSYGRLWAGTRFGVNQIFRDSTYSIKSYNFEEGFTGMGCNLGAIEEIDGGKLLFGTNDRLTQFLGERELHNNAPFTLQLTNLMMYNEEIPWTILEERQDTTIRLYNGVKLKNINFTGVSKWNNVPENLSLPYLHNYITFKFIAVTQNEIKKVTYEYILEGLDKHWNPPVTITEIPYGNLSPGNYSFKVRAISSDGVRSNEIDYKFSIRPPWWQTLWFYIFIVLTLVALIYFYIRYRERILKKDKELLEGKVREQTEALLLKNNELEVSNMEKDKLFSIIAHDLRGPFSSFLGLTEIMAEEVATFTDEELKSFAENMNISAKNLFNLLENLLQWSRLQRQSIPFSPTLVNLKASVEDNLGLIIESATKKNIRIKVDISEEYNFEADDSMLQIVIRNIISNAVKFTGKGGSIIIGAKLSGKGEIMISFKDNGIGMDEKMRSSLFKLDSKNGRSGTDGEPSTGLGLVICKELIEAHKGRIDVLSEVGKGTEFIITLPLKQS